MTLVSPGVQISIIDQSNYLPAATNSVPYILVATAQNKISGTSTNVAQGTLAANADQVYLITSQRDLATVFGNPFFYKTANGTPINGYELNEYGLLAAYSVLGVTNRCYVQRANIDLAALNATLVRPTGTPNNGTYWFDTAQTVWGINEWNQVTGAFTVETPIVITNTDQLDGGIPAPSLGSIGNYAIVATNTANPTYYKNADNNWVLVGSDEWKASWPSIQGTNSVTGLTAADVLIINGTSVAVPASTNNNLTGLVAAINSAAITGITAVKDSSNRLVIYADETANFGGDYGVVVIGIGSWSNVKELESKGIRVGKKQLDKSVFILNERVFCCCFLDVVFVFSGFSTRVGGAQEGAQQRAFHEWDGWRPEKGKLVRSGGGGQWHLAAAVAAASLTAARARAAGRGKMKGKHASSLCLPSLMLLVLVLSLVLLLLEQQQQQRQEQRQRAPSPLFSPPSSPFPPLWRRRRHLLPPASPPLAQPRPQPPRQRRRSHLRRPPGAPPPLSAPAAAKTAAAAARTEGRKTAPEAAAAAAAAAVAAAAEERASPSASRCCRRRTLRSAPRART